MAQSKTSKERSQKKAAYKEKAKEEAQQKKVPKTFLVPQTEWPREAILSLRGDLMEAAEQQAILCFQGLSQLLELNNRIGLEVQKLGQVLQMVIQQNIKEGKVTLTYKWNNGETPTEAEVETFQKQQAELLEKRKQEFETARANAQATENAEKTGLVSPDGQPIGSDQRLESEEEKEEA